ncbi:MAG TPA: DoxX family protein [Thermomonas sp.]|nr:DoxX family protein [Thermomonas sp.]
MRERANALPADTRPLAGIEATLRNYAWLGPLLLRLVFGWFWLETGWAKLHNLEFFAGRFVEWGIPFPTLSATVSGATDLVGGALLIVGLGTRLAAIPMIINMLVALAVVVLPTITTFNEFVELDEVLYVCVLFWLLMAGPGKASLDHLLARRFTKPA